MTTMVTELYDALRDAGASDDKARRAAEVVANYDDRFNRLERQIDGLDRKIDQIGSNLDRKIDQTKSDLEAQIAAVKADGVLMKWMLGAVFALLIPMFLRQFVH